MATKAPMPIAVDTEAIVQRIDAILQELAELRRMVIQSQAYPQGKNLAERLYGSAGQGTWDEYDPDLDWKRFSQ
ncbi:MAG TPA: hypothetical protein VF707_09430 [Ardenticatenaceae bacterium]|jgi:hypothetical protein